MDSTNYSRKPHLVCVPFPAQGHINPALKLAKLLHSQGFYITFVNTDFNHQRFIKFQGPDSVKGLPDFRFETIPDGLPMESGLDEARDIPALFGSIMANFLSPFKKLLSKLISSSLNDEVPPVSCIIFDTIMSFCIKAGKEFNIPHLPFWTASAISFSCYLHTRELRRRGLIPHKTEYFDNEVGDTSVDWIKGLRNLRLKDMPAFMGTSNDELMYEYLGSEAENSLSCSGMILNTFDAFEEGGIEAIIAATKFSLNKIYTIGPLNLLESHFESTPTIQPINLWKEDSECLKWLDKREPRSVVYVNYGSVSMIKDEDLKEFALGLANSKYPFLWIRRKDKLSVDDSMSLPRGFVEETRDRGMVTSWCSQEQVLAHPAVGVFVTHCGWNSTLEGVSHGMPLICWPWWADQQPNCRYTCTEWGNGVGVNYVVKRNEIENLIKEMMEGESGKKIREKALEWKMKAKEAAGVGGSSYNNFSMLIKEVMHCGK